MTDPAAVERFVRETLGCGCPDEVFRELRVEPAGDGYDAAIHVGGRLLVLLLRATDAELGERLACAVDVGKARRDREGYNRLRIVVVSDRQSDEPDLSSWPSNQVDDRVHLHIVSAADCPVRL